MSLARKTPLKRTPFKKKPSKHKNEFSSVIKRLVQGRSRGFCEAQTPVCRKYASHFHHIKMRSQGGPGTVENCLHVCSLCHHHIHHNPKESYAAGWLKRRADS